MKIAVSDLVTVFRRTTIGTKIDNRQVFLNELRKALPGERTCFHPNGQGMVLLHPAVFPLVQPGVVNTAGLESRDFVVRQHRGQWGHFVKRTPQVDEENPITWLAAVVYTADAYRRDPDVMSDPQRIEELADADYVLVSILSASNNEKDTPYPPNTLIHNIAGGNESFIAACDPMHPADSKAVHIAQDLGLLYRIIAEAKKTESYWATHALVAD